MSRAEREHIIILKGQWHRRVCNRQRQKKGINPFFKPNSILKMKSNTNIIGKPSKQKKNRYVKKDLYFVVDARIIHISFPPCSDACYVIIARPASSREDRLILTVSYCRMEWICKQYPFPSKHCICLLCKLCYMHFRGCWFAHIGEYMGDYVKPLTDADDVIQANNSVAVASPWFSNITHKFA